MNIDKLLVALNNNNNESIIELDHIQIAKDKNDILQKLNIPTKELKELHKKLKTYRYINSLDELRFGGYIRWISLKNPDAIKLTNGGIVCDMKEIDKDIHIKCKNNMNRMFQIKISEGIIFQKLNDQEQVILKALKHLET
jgi:hypothetical protein